MNQRIDQLWAQALDAAVPETYTRLSHSQVLKIKQVFAESIVRECSLMCLEDTDSQRILEHFGVEE
jgi:predicted Zn-dependent protease with MMP-like domain